MAFIIAFKINGDSASMSNLDISEINKNLIELNLRLGNVEKDIEQLTERFDAHESSEAKQINEIITAMTENTRTVQDLAKKTQIIIELTTDAQGFIKMTKRIGGFAIWCTKAGSFIGVLIVAFHYLKTKVGF